MLLKILVLYYFFCWDMLGSVEEIEGEIVLIGFLIPGPEFELSVLSEHLPVTVYWWWVCGKNFVP